MMYNYMLDKEELFSDGKSPVRLLFPKNLSSINENTLKVYKRKRKRKQDNTNIRGNKSTSYK
jgi:hypothetical protein